jgi:3'-phosphoadenosine 5'-phosphosulfate sulfotransferase (PAPS reductase)/FAD synthetase
MWDRERPQPPVDKIQASAELMDRVIREYQPTHIVSLVSGGRDSAANHEVAKLLGIKVDLIMHGRTGTGIPETTQHVIDTFGNAGSDFAVADAGTKYEEYVMRKGFFGVGRDAHNFSYRILKQDPFNATLSRLIRQRRRGFRIMLLTGARKSESENRRLNLPVTKLKKGNLWVNPIHDWTSGDRDQLLEANAVPINPVAVQLCRSGECMCGTMQDKADRAEASVLYPHWGRWLDDLEAAAKRKHGFGWGDQFPKPRDPLQGDLFQPMCAGCERKEAA